MAIGPNPSRVICDYLETLEMPREHPLGNTPQAQHPLGKIPRSGLAVVARTYKCSRSNIFRQFNLTIAN